MSPPKDDWGSAQGESGLRAADHMHVQLNGSANGEHHHAAKPRPPNEDAVPLIRFAEGKLSEIASEAETLLIAADVQFYQRGSVLVRPVSDTVTAAGGGRTKTVSLKPVTATYMRDQLSRQIEWETFRRREKEWRPIDPPKEVAETMLDRAGEWGFHSIVGVVTTPTLRPDGTILSATGYDPATQLLLVDPPKLPPIPENPSRDDAARSLDFLDDLLEEFPFEVDKGESRAVALSALITPVVRGAFPVTPAHATRAPTAGTGKSYMYDIASAIAVGQPCHVIAIGKTEEETEKRLAACLLAGYPLTNIDNVNGELGGDFLCQITERPLVSPRVLGRSEQPLLPNRMTIFATGNNLRLKGDMTRRALVCSLDARIRRGTQERTDSGSSPDRRRQSPTRNHRLLVVRQPAGKQLRARLKLAVLSLAQAFSADLTVCDTRAHLALRAAQILSQLRQPIGLTCQWHRRLPLLDLRGRGSHRSRRVRRAGRAPCLLGHRG